MKRYKEANDRLRVPAELKERVTAERSRPALSHPRYVAVTAALLVLVFLVGTVLWPGGGLKSYAIAEAEYPKMAQYPGGGMFSMLRYDAWREDKNALRQEAGYADALDGFFAESIPLFLQGEAGENKVYSPVNVFMALAMLSEVTGGDTRQQLLDAIGVTDLQQLHVLANQVWRSNYSDDGAVTSILANSFWLADDFPYREEALQSLASNYYASSYQGKMGSKGYNKALQNWLNEQTSGLLQEQVSQVEMDPLTVLTLASTVYFRAKWGAEFNENQTKPQTFHAAVGDMTCDFMNKRTMGSYYWSEKFSAISLHLENSGAMWLILPDEGVTTQELLADSRTTDFILAGTEWQDNTYIRINLSLPKFDVVSTTDLSAGLQQMGVTEVFNVAGADFSALTDSTLPIYLSQAEHSARVAIDEEGVTAAAYTVMAGDGSSAPPKDEIDFVVDRPFLFVLTGSDGLPLFTGVVQQP